MYQHKNRLFATFQSSVDNVNAISLIEHSHILYVGHPARDETRTQSITKQTLLTGWEKVKKFIVQMDPDVVIIADLAIEVDCFDWQQHFYVSTKNRTSHGKVALASLTNPMTKIIFIPNILTHNLKKIEPVKEMG